MMKNALLSCLLTFVSLTSSGQMDWQINFDPPSTLDRLTIDTITNPNNAWQIGHPNKTIFAIANSEPNVIVTDTINPYPVNDTSSFIIVHIASEAWQYAYPNITIGGYYNVNSDSLTDYGFIDYSLNLGNTWHLVDSTDDYCGWSNPVLPVFTGNSNGWKYFNYCLDIPITANLGDTVLYRFTFISDSIQTNKEGLMFDDLHFEDWVEGIEESAQVQSKTYPNPASQSMTIEFDNPEYSVFYLAVTDALGRLIFKDKVSQQTLQLTTDNFPDGIYYYSLTSTERSKRAWGKFVVQKE